MASRQIKLAFSSFTVSFTVSFWKEENLTYFYNTFKGTKNLRNINDAVLLIEAIP